MTTRRDRLPAGPKSRYWHKKGTSPADKKARVARFLQPIVAVKKVLFDVNSRHKSYTQVDCSFQSTSSCNITTVNALNSCEFFAVPKQRGQGKYKRHWQIEMNEARQLYLNTYHKLDVLDGKLKRCHINYRSHKYWHAAKNHGYAMSLVVAYDIYRELATEKESLQEFGIQAEAAPNVVDFRTFRDILSTQGLHYDPNDQFYPGDAEMRVNTKKRKSDRLESIKKRRRGRPKKSEQDNAPHTHPVTKEMFESFSDGLNSRLCGDLTKFQEHVDSIERTKHQHVCKVCGGPSYTRCNLCPGKPSLHFFPGRGTNKGKSCFVHGHDDNWFGLCRDDATMIGHQVQNWCLPTKQMIRSHRAYMYKLKTTDAGDDTTTEESTQ